MAFGALAVCEKFVGVVADACPRAIVPERSAGLGPLEPVVRRRDLLEVIDHKSANPRHHI